MAQNNPGHLAGPVNGFNPVVRDSKAIRLLKINSDGVAGIESLKDQLVIRYPLYSGKMRPDTGLVIYKSIIL